jgi:hypothetical protein
MMSDKLPLAVIEMATWCQASTTRPGKAEGRVGVPTYEAVKPALDAQFPL